MGAAHRESHVLQVDAKVADAVLVARVHGAAADSGCSTWLPMPEKTGHAHCEREREHGEDSEAERRDPADRVSR